MKEEIISKIHKLVDEYYLNNKEEFTPGKTKIGVGAPIYDQNEVKNVIDSLFSGWISQSKNVALFEKNFAEYHGVKYGIAVNSGSSANLVALASVLESKDIKKNCEVIVPATTFPTAVSPVIQLGLKPVFVDVDAKTFNIDPDEIEKAITDNTGMITPAHFLGYPSDMDKISKIAEKHNLKVMEDCCEAHGAKIDDKKVGSFGDIATSSFFVAHNMTTGEGGMIITNNPKYADLARSIRAFGRACTCPICLLNEGKPCKLKDFHDPVLKSYNIRQVFLRMGYSLKMVEMVAAFGIEQFKKLDAFNQKRRENAHYYINQLKKYNDSLRLPEELKNIEHVYYAFPIVVKKDAPFTREELTSYLEKHRVETRPFFGGNLPDQPAFRDQDIKVIGDLPVARLLRDNGFFIGSHPGISKEQREFVTSTFHSFFEKNTKTIRQNKK